MMVQIFRLYDVERDIKRVSQYDSLRIQMYNDIIQLNDSNPSELTIFKNFLGKLDQIKYWENE